MSSFLSYIEQPTLLLDSIKCQRNIRRMVEKASQSRVRFRPHFKTHQSAMIGSWFSQEGVEAITVSSLDMAIYFAENGWRDITLAFPVHPRQFSRIQQLSKKCTLHLVVDSLITAKLLLAQVNLEVKVWIKIDAGNHRAGIHVENKIEIQRLVSVLKNAPNLIWKGFLAHDGQTYGCRSTEEIGVSHLSFLNCLNTMANPFRKDYPSLEISIGDTPSCSSQSDFKGANEIRPGVFVFYDGMQEQIGVCNHENQAICMACPVVAIYPERQEVLIHGGAIHFSKEALAVEGEKQFGKVVILTNSGWSEPIEGVVLKKISQEHGLISGPTDWIKAQKVGALLGVMPVHACLTANLMKRFFTLEGTEIRQMPTF